MKHINSEGSFECVVTDPTAGWIGESGEKETPFIRVPVVVTDDGPEKGAVAVWQGWLSNAAFENTIKRLKEVFGFNGDLAALATGRQTFAGKPCNIQTEFETYEGKRRCKIKWLNPAGGGGSEGKPMEQRKLGELLSRLNSRAMAIAGMTKQDQDANPEDTVPF